MKLFVSEPRFIVQQNKTIINQQQNQDSKLTITKAFTIFFNGEILQKIKD